MDSKNEVKILYLDIDGVCNRKGTWKIPKELIADCWILHAIEEGNDGWVGVEPEIIEMINDICKKKTNCSIVISSTWANDHLFGFDLTLKILRAFGLKVVCNTPMLNAKAVTCWYNTGDSNPKKIICYTDSLNCDF